MSAVRNKINSDQAPAYARSQERKLLLMAVELKSGALADPVGIRNTVCPNRVFLAPLAGVSDWPFRRICQTMGAGLTFVEMLSAAAVIHQSPRTLTMMRRHRDEELLGVQVTGSSADEVASAVGILDRSDFDVIDINMGCPVRKIVAKGWGSAMLLDPDRVSRTVAACRSATDRVLSVKIRIGYSRECMNVDDISRRVVEAGADMLTIHGRARGENYETPSDWACIEKAAACAREASGGNCIVVGNGDALDAESGRQMQIKTGCDAIMIARGALGNPWVFRECRDGTPSTLGPEEWLDVIFQHMAWHEERHPVERSAALFRKHLLWYVQGFPRSREAKTFLGVVETLDEARRFLEKFAAEMPVGTCRQPSYRYGLNAGESRAPSAGKGSQQAV